MGIILSSLRQVLALPLLVTATVLKGQLLMAPSLLKGGGMLQTCDTSMHVGFSTAYLDGYACQFTPEIEAGATTVSGWFWNYYDGAAWVEEYGSPTVPYFGAEPYPICLTVNAFDQTASLPCSASVCKVVEPLPFAVCAGLEPGFTIESVQGSTITFANQSQFDGGEVASVIWSFGDGASSTAAASPSHDFAGNGPFQVCLTVVGPPPTSCTATLCQWLYMGPGGVPCEELVNQGFMVLQHNEVVGVLDTSLTSGMNAEVSWDFGDGSTASGTIAVHAYVPFQNYDLCGTLRVWGPVLSDTCVTTVCRQVYPFAAVSVPEPEGGQRAFAWPNPFKDQVFLGPMPKGGSLQVHDGLGRLVYERSIAPGAHPQPVWLTDLPSGCYTFAVWNGAERGIQRAVKEP